MGRLGIRKCKCKRRHCNLRWVRKATDCKDLPLGVRRLKVYIKVSGVMGNSLKVHKTEGLLILTWWRFRIAVGKRISCVSVGTCARRGVVDHGALSSDATRSRTWIAAFFGHASSVAGTFRVNCALGSTVGRASCVIWQASARRHAADVSALRVETAR
jgi:hypothetical protein